MPVSVVSPDVMTHTRYTVVVVAAMLVLTAFASMPVAAQEASVAVTTGSASAITDTSATLEGELTELEEADNATVWFEYWEEGDPASNATTDAIVLAEPGTFSASVDGLANNTTYVFVAHAATENASAVGEPATFTTLDRSAPLGVETGEAADVTNDSATLNGALTGLDNEPNATVWFTYWEEGDPANTSTSASQELSAPGPFDKTVDELANDTTYVYVAHARSNGSDVTGDEVTFTTGATADDGQSWDGEGPFGQWLTSVLKNLVPPDGDVPFGQLVSDIVTANNPGSEHRSDEANPGGDGSGPPEHAGPPDDDERGPPDHATGDKSDEADTTDDEEEEDDEDDTDDSN